jgi:hypothetical protein
MTNAAIAPRPLAAIKKNARRRQGANRGGSMLCNRRQNCRPVPLMLVASAGSRALESRNAEMPGFSYRHDIQYVLRAATSHGSPH